MTGDRMPIGKPSSAPIIPADYHLDSAMDDFDGLQVSPWLTVAMTVGAVLVGVSVFVLLSLALSVGQWLGGVK